MSLTATRLLPAFVLVVVLSGIPAVTCAQQHGGGRTVHPHPPRHTATANVGLYSPRLRRSTILYLRLRLLELREEGLDRARLAIERRLSIDDLLRVPAHAEPAAP
jgi:hypothetical protein